MPQTTAARAARWPGSDLQATVFLMSHGYVLTKRWTWIKPAYFHRPTADEDDAIAYMIEEWDFGGIEMPPCPGDITKPFNTYGYYAE